MAPGLGLLTPLLMLTVDQVVFAGASLQRVRELAAQPLALRLVIVFYSGATEELIFRLILATFVGWLTYMVLSRFIVRPKVLAQWLGVVGSALLFGLAHVGNLPDAPHPVLRAVTVNGIAGLILGWLYWWHGLEMAVITHMFAIAVLYIAVPIFL